MTLVPRQIILSLICTIAFLIHQFTEPFIHFVFIDSYLDDICFLPVAYGFITLVIRSVINDNFKMNLQMVLLGVIITGLATEWLFPKLSNKHTGDIFDIVAYTVGGILFWFIGYQSPVNLKGTA
ncbi:MAG: hypothetical protein ACPGLV_05840 [Bacteroidia bacterium]